MPPRIGSLAGATFMTTALPYRLAAEDDNKRNRKVLFFTKSSGFEHDLVKRTGGGPSLSETALTDIGRTRGFEVVATKDGRIFDSDLARYDAFFFFTTGDLTEAGTDKMPPISAQGKEALLAAIRDGKGFIGIHSASDTFHSKGKHFQTQEQPDPYIAIRHRHTPMITTMHSDQNASPPRVEVITSVQRRRRWPTAEKIRPRRSPGILGPVACSDAS
jgi:Trehalose utilisation